MSADENLFEMSAELNVRFVKLGGQIPVILADNFYQRPDEYVRWRWALIMYRHHIRIPAS
jgi:hypothetical protein